MSLNSRTRCHINTSPAPLAADPAADTLQGCLPDLLVIKWPGTGLLSRRLPAHIGLYCAPATFL
jgi:hypothetical protein